jgi:hypothetical protein
MKTVFIFDRSYEADIKFFVVDGDHSRFDGVYLGDWSDLSVELNNLLYAFDEDEDKLKFKFKFVDKFPVSEVLDGAKVIISGYVY